MTEITFEEWPKTPRLFRDIVVTEKIDGTNAAIIITDDGRVAAQSRKRLITPEADNFGFAAWVEANADALRYILGPGRHFGEWWGRGIQRGYDMETRRFSVFNTDRWYKSVDPLDPNDTMSTRAWVRNLDDEINAVPVMYHGSFYEAKILSRLADLRDGGSVAAPGFMNPEGICVYHTQSRQVYKVTLDHQDRGKWELAA